MNTDIRLSTGFWQHPKTKKTVKRLGLEGIRSLQVLWLWAAQNKPDGNLVGMDWEDIELAADWQGEERAFFDHCLGVWIDEVEGGYVLHDWAEHNPWQAEAASRSAQARKNANAGWEKRRAKQPHDSGNADSMPPQCDGNAPAKQPHDSGNAPSPSPSPEKIQGGGNIYARGRVADSVPEKPADDIPGIPPGPKRTDCPGKGHPQWRAFLSCWDVYPVQQGQEKAWCEWMCLWENHTLAEPYAIRDAILLLSQEDSRWKRGKIQNMARWLNGKGWEDKPFREPAAVAPAGGGQTRAPTEHQRRQQENRNMAAALLAAREQERQCIGGGHAGQTAIGNAAR